MASNIRIIHARDFVKLTADGWLDLDKSRALLLQVAAASSPLSEYQVILDIRTAQSRMTSVELWELAVELSKLRNTFASRTAVLCSPDRVKSAEFFAICARNMGFGVRAFTSFEEAIEWLVSDEALL